MKNLLYFLPFILYLFPYEGKAQPTDEELFAQAGSAYNRGDYQVAIDNYQRILSKGKGSVSLYYNLANAYYKQEEVARSIYYYEKALQLAPEDKAIQTNLKYAQQMTLDEIVPLPQMWSQRVVATLSRWNSPSGWGAWAVGSMCLFVGFFFCYYFLQKIIYKRLFFTLMIVALMISVGSFFLGRTVSKYTEANHYAILFDKEVRLYEQPNTYSKEVFALHEGTKVEILDKVKEWYKIKVADGRIGWTKKHSVKKL